MTSKELKILIEKAKRNKAYLTSIPKEATAQVDQYSEQGVPTSISYYSKDALVGRRVFHENGALFSEYSIRAEKYHGNYYYFHDDGTLQYQCAFQDGRQKGLATQWSQSGDLLCISVFENGTGIDLWCTLNEAGNPELSEERSYRDGLLDGWTRWWDSETTVWREEHYKNGQPHGIFREWEQGGLAKGFPTFYVDGKAVAKATYLAERERKRSIDLPLFSIAANSPQRTPNEFYAQQRGLKGL